MVKILDTTLRDGSYVIDYQFTAQDTALIAAALESAGIELIEIGHGLGLNASAVGKGYAATSDEEYLKAARRVLSRAQFGMFIIPGIGRLEDLDLAAQYGMDFVRVGTNASEAAEAEPFIKKAKKLGFRVSSNLMKSYVLSPEALAESARLVEAAGCEIVCVVDSAGGMLPEDIERYFDSLHKAVKIDIGFHGHNNLGLAIANSLKAIECGATIVDSTLQGMGRSSGNAATEILATVLKRKGLTPPNLDINLLMDIGERLIKPFLRQPGLDPIGITSGYAQFHSSYLGVIMKYAKMYDLDPRDLIVRLCERDKVNAPEELVQQISEELSAQKTELSKISTISFARLDMSDAAKLRADSPEAQCQQIAQIIKRESIRKGKQSVFNIVIANVPRSELRPSPFIQEGFHFIVGTVELARPEYIERVVPPVDGIVDYILVDAEQKSDFDLIATLQTITRHSQIFTYRDNEAWVKAIEGLITQFKPNLYRRDILITGINQLSLKLSAALAERGARVWLIDNELSRAQNVDHLQALVKTGSLAAVGEVNELPDMIDLIIGYTPRQPTVNLAMLARLKSDGMIVDAGIGSIDPEAIEAARRSGVEVTRVDMRAIIAAEVAACLGASYLHQKVTGRAQVGNVSIVAGGAIGREGDIILDSISEPTDLVGVADGRGNVIYDLSDYQDRINIVREYILKRNLGVK